MKNATKSFKELNIIDNYLINKIASDKELSKPFCKILLTSLLGREFEIINVTAESIFPGITNHHRGIRMDVEVEAATIDNLNDALANASDNATNNNSAKRASIYDIEPHRLGNNNITNERNNMLKHNRFYQAMLDSKLLKRGERDFTKLKDVYIITITDFDLFGEDYMQYTVHNKCDELPNMPYDDGLTFLYFYTKGTKGGSISLKNMLKYIEKSDDDNVKDSSTKQINNIVSTIKNDDRWEADYMEWEAYIRSRMEEYADDIQKENDELRARADAAESKLSDAENKLSDAENKLSDTKSKLSDTENKLSDTENKLSDAESEVQHLKQELAKLKSIQ